MDRRRVLSPCLLSSLRPPLHFSSACYYLVVYNAIPGTSTLATPPIGSPTHDPYASFEPKPHLHPTTMAPRSRKGRASPSPAPPASNGDTPPPPPSKDEQSAPHRSSIDTLLVPVPAEQREEVKVNNASATDMKHACDDALKRVRLPSHLLRLPRLRRPSRSTCRLPTTTTHPQHCDVWSARSPQWVSLDIRARDPLSIATRSSCACSAFQAALHTPAGAQVGGRVLGSARIDVEWRRGQPRAPQRARRVS